MQQKEQHVPEKKIYFTAIINSGVGLADHLDQFIMLRKLGLSLSYSYLHTPLYSTRHINTLPVNWPLLLRKLRSKILLLYKKFTYGNTYIYDFLGLNEYFSSRKLNVNQQPGIRKWEILDFSMETLSATEKNNIATLEDLQNYIKRRASAISNSPNPILVRLSIGGLVTGIRKEIRVLTPHSIKQPNLREIYFDRRSKRPWKSKFPSGKLKTVVHIRMGDIASIKTPWGTWLYRGRRG